MHNSIEGLRVSRDSACRFIRSSRHRVSRLRYESTLYAQRPCTDKRDIPTWSSPRPSHVACRCRYPWTADETPGRICRAWPTTYGCHQTNPKRQYSAGCRVVDVAIATARICPQAKNVRGVVVNRPSARFKVEKFRATVWFERLEAVHNTGRRNDGNIEPGERLVRNGNPVTHGIPHEQDRISNRSPCTLRSGAASVAFPRSPPLARYRAGSSWCNPPPYTGYSETIAPVVVSRRRRYVHTSGAGGRSC